MIRLAHLADADALARIEARSWRRAYRSLLPEARLAELESDARVAHWRSRLRSNGRRRGRAIVVATRHDEAVGYATLGPADHADLEPGFAGEIYELYVDPEAQRRGVGTELLDDGMERLRSSGFGWVVIEVLVDNAPGRAFYAARGLATEGRTRRRASSERAPGGQRYSLPNSSVRVIRYETSLWDLDPPTLLGTTTA